MQITWREFWLLFHLGLGALLIHSFFFSFMMLGKKEAHPWLKPTLIFLVIGAWITVIHGTFTIYPWYRATPPLGANILDYPRSFLKAHEAISGWHSFGMEWKEHISWLAPILISAIAWVELRYHNLLQRLPQGPAMLRLLWLTAFFCVLVPGILGAFLNKVAPNNFLDLP